MHIEQTLKQMREMRLSNMANSLEERLKHRDQQDLTHEEFISLLIEDEYNARKNRKLSRAIGRANFKPGNASIENLKYSSARGLIKKDVMTFTSSTWIENCSSLIITGPTGTGKTYLAEAIGLRACIMGYSALKIRYRKLFDEIATARGTGTYSKYVEKLERVKVLIVDDFGISSIDKKQTADLMDLIEDRDQRGVLIITSQYPIEAWHERFPDPTLADAICDRMVHSSYKIELTGDSLRRGPK